MKKLLIVILVITLPLITFFQFKNYRRFHPPVNYEYAISEAIDPNYHDQAMLDEYYTKAIEIGAFSRTQWRNSGLDVRFPNADRVAEVNAAKYYNQLLSRVNLLEDRLEASSKLKNEGLNNDEISLIEQGYSKKEIAWLGEVENILNVQFGDQSEYVWNVQKRLISKGYDHALDGLFGIDTQNAILSFQNDNGIYPSGLIGRSTFDLLFLE